jgi:hypothetical protein
LTFCIHVLYYIFNKGVKGGEEEKWNGRDYGYEKGKMVEKVCLGKLKERIKGERRG